MPNASHPVQRVLLVGAVGKVKVSMKGVGPSIARVCDSLEPHLRSAGLFAEAPFDCMHLIIQVSETEDRRVQFGRVSSRHRELPVTIMVTPDFVLNKGTAKLDQDLRQLIVDTILQVAHKQGASPDLFLSLCRRDE